MMPRSEPDRRREQALAAFGQAVRHLREQRGIGPSELSNRSKTPSGRKVSSRRIGRIEAGEVDPRYDEMLAVAEGLGIKPGELVAYAEERTPAHAS
ncbi:MAG: helix-turn-helix domain-containing protein [Solirubrobacteraceae bacterium]